MENNHDSGSGSLRDALASATPGSTITVPAFTITLATPIAVTQASPGVTINGAGADSTTISGNSTTRIFKMDAATEMTLSGLTLTGGKVSGDYGGAIQAASASTLTISNSTLSNNGSDLGFGGAIRMESDGRLTINNSTFSDNHADSGIGGAIQLQKNGTLTISNSTLSGNHTDSGLGGAIQMYDDGTLTITNSTLSGNHANSGLGGAIDLKPGVHGRILSSTIDANTASSGKGGGIRSESTTTGQVAFKNSIVSGNTATTDANCSFASLGLVSQGYNDENGSSCPFSAVGDLKADPMLGPLRNNGGLTFTQAPGGASPVIDAGTNSDCPATDQRGSPRLDNRELVCDIGAYETQDSSGPAPGAAFGPTPAPVPAAAAPPAPTCTGTVGPKISSSGASGHGARKRARGPSVVTIVVNCDQSTSVVLAGTVSATNKKRKKGRGASAAKKPRVQTFSLTSRSATIQARTSTKLTLVISKRTLTKLSRLAGLHATLAASLSLTATNAHGRRITRLAAHTIKLSKNKR